MLRIIALYKLLKVLLLLLAAYGELRLHDAALSAKLATWAQGRPLGLEHAVVTRALTLFSGLSETEIHVMRIATFTYAAVFAIEGIGLWMQKRLVVIGNAAIVAYLVWHVRAKGRGAGAAAPAAPAAAQPNSPEERGRRS
jgi:uncharacterized membrane protein (DUF2068 family)